jgi:hypothetical protein
VPALEDLVQRKGEPQLGLPLLGVRVAEVREDVAATAGDFIRRKLVSVS